MERTESGWVDSSRSFGLFQWKEEIGLPLIVSLGFLRLFTNPRVFQNPLTVAHALDWLSAFRAARGVRELQPGKAHAGILGRLFLAAGTGGNLVSDAHLAALALEHDASIATADRDFLRFTGVKVKILF